MSVVTWILSHKTYLLSLLGAALTAAWYMKWIDDATYSLLIGFTGAGSIASLRHGIAKVENGPVK